MKAENWKLGYSILHNPEDELPVSSHFQALKDAHIECVETGVRQACAGSVFYPHNEVLKSLIGSYQDSGIEVWSVHLPLGGPIDISDPQTAETGIVLFEQNLRVIKEMGVEKAVIHPSYEPIHSQRSLRVETCQNSLRILAQLGVKLAVETLPRTCLCSTIEETIDLLSPLKDIVYCCVDVNHFHKGNICDMITAVQDQLITLHISDDDGVDEKHYYPGEGVIQWREVMETLESIGYDGAFVYGTRYLYDPPQKVRDNYNWLLKTLRQLE